MLRLHSLLLFSLVLALLSACGGTTTAPSAPTASTAPTALVPTSAPTALPLPTSVPTLAPTAPPAVPTDAAGVPGDLWAAIVAAFTALDAHGPYRMQITSTADANPAALLVVPPDRSRYTSSLDGKPVEVVSIGDTSYVLNPDGSWVKSLASGAGGAQGFSAEDVADIQNPEALGVQVINGISTTSYRFGSAANPGVISTIWVGPDGAPVQFATKSENDVTTYAITYDASITIEAPIP